MRAKHAFQQASKLQIAQIVECTEAEGPGKRFAVWFQGCPLRCVACCNPEMLSFSGGKSTRLLEILDRLDVACRVHGIEGITLLGGEPIAHADGAWQLAQGAIERNLSVMVFSGYTLEQIEQMSASSVRSLLDHTDILVDGPYDHRQPEPQRRWIGSRNQRIHFLSDRYSRQDPCWRLPNTLEIRYQHGELSVNGFPAPSAVDVWRRF